MSDHPEGGWRNPLWRAMAIAAIAILVLIARLVTLIIKTVFW